MTSRWIAICIGVLVWIAALAGAIAAIPSSNASQSYRAALKAARAGDWPETERLSRRVLSQHPRASLPRAVLACALWNEGQKSDAAINLYKAVADGLVLPLQGVCGREPNLRDLFTTASIGTTDLLVVYTGPEGAPFAIRALNTHLPEGERLLNAACAGMNSDLIAFGAEPLNLYQERDFPAGTSVEDFFRGCLRNYDSWFTCEPNGLAGEPHCFLAWEREMVRRKELASL